MNPLDWKTCDENELWRYVAWHLEGEGISCVMQELAVWCEGEGASPAFQELERNLKNTP